MSENKKEKKVKIVQIKENKLVDLIDGIVTEAVAVEKKAWIAEQATKENNKNSLLESRIEKLEELISKAKITKIVR
jgi:hypothetical protein